MITISKTSWHARVIYHNTNFNIDGVQDLCVYIGMFIWGGFKLLCKLAMVAMVFMAIGDFLAWTTAAVVTQNLDIRADFGAQAIGLVLACVVIGGIPFTMLYYIVHLIILIEHKNEGIPYGDTPKLFRIVYKAYTILRKWCYVQIQVKE